MTIDDSVIISRAPNISSTLPENDSIIDEKIKLNDSMSATLPTGSPSSALIGTKKIPAQLSTSPMLNIVTIVQHAATT